MQNQTFNLKIIEMANSSNTLLGLLAGTAIGATLGILFAPDKGSNTRQYLSDEAIARKDRLSEQAADFKTRAQSTYASKKETLDAKVENIVSDVSHKAEDVITTLEAKLKELKAKNKNLQKPTPTTPQNPTA